MCEYDMESVCTVSWEEIQLGEMCFYLKGRAIPTCLQFRSPLAPTIDCHRHEQDTVMEADIEQLVEERQSRLAGKLCVVYGLEKIEDPGCGRDRFGLHKINLQTSPTSGRPAREHS